MKLLLAIAGGGVGIIVTASAVFLIWYRMQYQQNKAALQEAQSTEESWDEGSSPSSGVVSAPMLLGWTFFDYGLIFVFAVGSLFLFTDALAVIRDADSYPLYHYGYLLCGFVFTLFGMLFMIFRLSLVFSLFRSERTAPAPNHHHEPGHAEQAE